MQKRRHWRLFGFAVGKCNTGGVDGDVDTTRTIRPRHCSKQPGRINRGGRVLDLIKDTRGVTLIDFLIVLVPFMTILIMVLSAGLSWHQLSVVRSVKNFYLERTVAEGQLTAADLTDMEADFNDAGFTLQKVEVSDKDGNLIGTDTAEAIVRDSANLRNSKITLLIEVKPDKIPFASAVMFGKTGPDGFVYVTQGRGHSELPRKD